MLGRVASAEPSDYPQSELTRKIIGAAFEVHRTLGPGFLEKVYENALLHQLRLSGVRAVGQRQLKVIYKGCEAGVYVADLVVEDAVLCEIKAGASLAPEHIAQVINYLKATQMKVGLLINFGGKRVQVKRLVV